MQLIQDRAPTSDEAITLGNEIAQNPPEGYHFWRLELQRSDRGRRTTIRVWFRQDLKRAIDGAATTSRRDGSNR